MALAPQLLTALEGFKAQNNIVNSGGLGTVLVVTRRAKKLGLPLDMTALLTPRGGQVSGHGGKNINKVLQEHGETREVGTESGRTSRGSIILAKDYAAFLNGLSLGPGEIEEVEAWWVERFGEFFDTDPFELNYDAGSSLAAVIQNLIEQAIDRQKKRPGTRYAGAVLQHLVGAKLELAMPEVAITHNGSSVADAVSSRSGDFVLDTSILHCTMAPGDLLMQKCKDNISSGMQPMILTVGRGVSTAQGLAETHGILGRVEIMDAVQFLAANLYEMSLFKGANRRVKVAELVAKYNEIIAANEADASLRIDFE
jgi:Domain of unknown function (DUF4928)